MLSFFFLDKEHYEIMEYTRIRYTHKRVEEKKKFRLRLVRVKVFSENIQFSGNAIFRKGKYFHVFGCISKNVSENIF